MQERPAAATTHITPAELSRRLSSRFVSQGQWDSNRAREQFVECILIAELGEDLARDPAFHELVSQVSAELDRHPTVSARVDEILKGILRS